MIESNDFMKQKPLSPQKIIKITSQISQHLALINPSKSEIGKISKSVLDKINNALVENTNVNQLKNRTNTKQSFKIIPNQKLSSFVKFDIGNFYPSISE